MRTTPNKFVLIHAQLDHLFIALFKNMQRKGHSWKQNSVVEEIVAIYRMAFLLYPGGDDWLCRTHHHQQAWGNRPLEGDIPPEPLGSGYNR